MAPHPDRIDALADRSWDDAVGSVLDQPDRPGTVPETDDWPDATRWWLRRMTEPEAGLQDRMAWFWHGLLTTNAHKVAESSLVARQLQLLRDGALGNYRDLLHGFVTSGALLEYLDASYSMAANPNENLARELMELFTLGRGHYNQDDVRAAARALAGWVVDDGEVEFRRDHAFIAPLVFLGDQADWDTASIVDRLCDDPATAERVAGRLWTNLVGTEPPPEDGADLGRWWQDRDLEIRPLVERIVTSPEFERSRFARPRTGLEWFAAAAVATGFPIDDQWQLERLGQHPYLPPNVAGWPDDDRWLAAGSLLARASIASSIDLGDALPDDPDRWAEPGEILARCGLDGASAATVAALRRVADTPDIDPETTRLVRWRLALTCPEFQLS